VQDELMEGPIAASRRSSRVDGALRSTSSARLASTSRTIWSQRRGPGPACARPDRAPRRHRALQGSDADRRIGPRLRRDPRQAGAEAPVGSLTGREVRLAAIQPLAETVAVSWGLRWGQILTLHRRGYMSDTQP
jgi:hypothetical protein